jgi:hypothetical protein
MSYELLTWAQFESEVAEKAQFTVIHGKVYDLSQEFCIGTLVVLLPRHR